MRFEPSSYTVDEGETVRVCAVVVGATDIAVTVGVSTNPLDAEGKR